MNSFSVYKELENEKMMNKEIKVEYSPTAALEEIIEFYENGVKTEIRYDYWAYPDAKRLMKKMEEGVRGMDYNLNDIERFCLEIRNRNTKFFCDYFGVYLSALINKIISDGDKITLQLRGLKDGIGYIGSELKKGKIIVNGNAGNYIGEKMEGGEIVVYGSVGDEVSCQMYGGRIRIKGSAGDHLGRFMDKGEITIEKHAGIHLGCFMMGGKITVNGSKPLDICDDAEHGEIYHKDKKVFSH